MKLETLRFDRNVVKSNDLGDPQLGFKFCGLWNLELSTSTMQDLGAKLD